MTRDNLQAAAATEAPQWDTSSHEDFYSYYEQQSLSENTMERFRLVTEMLLRRLEGRASSAPLEVLDIGCGAGAQSKFWAQRGHAYRGIDINRPLIELAARRAGELGIAARFDVGSATELPVATASMDICLLPELLEHGADWQAVIAEAARVLRPGGLMYISTSNRLCPVQQEFNLPLYSWYPRPLKRYFERRASTDWPSLANFAKYPAVHWFSYYGLRDHLAGLGFRSSDRFDLIDLRGKSAKARAVVALLRGSSLLRWLGHVTTPYTVVVAVKQPGDARAARPAGAGKRRAEVPAAGR